MITLRFHKLTRLACATVLAGTATMLLAATISAPAHAASVKKVLAACARTKGCWSIGGSAGTIGCSPHSCFSCDKAGTCKPVPKIEKGEGHVLNGSAGAASAPSGTGTKPPLHNVDQPIVVQHSGGVRSGGSKH